MGGEVDGDVSHEDGERRAAGLDYREGSPQKSQVKRSRTQRLLLACKV